MICFAKESRRDEARLFLYGDAEKIRGEMEKADKRMMEIKVTAAKHTKEDYPCPLTWKWAHKKSAPKDAFVH